MRVDAAHPKAVEIKRMAGELEQAYLETESLPPLSKSFTDFEENVWVLVHHDIRSNQSLALVMPQDEIANLPTEAVY